MRKFEGCAVYYAVISDEQALESLVVDGLGF